MSGFTSCLHRMMSSSKVYSCTGCIQSLFALKITMQFSYCFSLYYHCFCKDCYMYSHKLKWGKKKFASYFAGVKKQTKQNKRTNKKKTQQGLHNFHSLNFQVMKEICFTHYQAITQANSIPITSSRFQSSMAEEM